MGNDHWRAFGTNGGLLPRRGITYQPRASAAASAAKRRPGSKGSETRQAL
jgi:hypothetical protein